MVKVKSWTSQEVISRTVTSGAFATLSYKILKCSPIWRISKELMSVHVTMTILPQSPKLLKLYKLVKICFLGATLLPNSNVVKPNVFSTQINFGVAKWLQQRF